jgi:hypothetical protein
MKAVRSAAFARIQVERHYADLTYSLKASSAPVSVDNEIRGASVDIDPNGYLSVFDVLYTKKVDQSADNSLSCALLTAVGGLLDSSTHVIEALLLPVIQQQSFGISSDENGRLFNASFAKQSYTVIVAKGQTQIFTAVTSFLLLWCVFVTLYSWWHRVPEISSFTEIDLLGRLPINLEHKSEEGRGLCELQSRINRSKLWNITRALQGVTLFIEEGPGDVESYELQTGAIVSTSTSSGTDTGSE